MKIMIERLLFICGLIDIDPANYLGFTIVFFYL